MTVVARPGAGVVCEEPTVFAVDEAGHPVAFGRSAESLIGRSAGRICLVRPLVHGELSEPQLAERGLSMVLGGIGVSRRSRADICAIVPACQTNVQSRALLVALERVGAKRVELVPAPLACALGARLPIDDAAGSMVVDLGGGSTSIGVVALGGTVVAERVRLGGGDLDDAIRQCCAEKFGVLITAAMAEKVKLAIGVALPAMVEDLAAQCHGRDADNGEERTVLLDAHVVAEAVDPVIGAIVDGCVGALASVPPELGNDLLYRGIHLSGGGALLAGFDRRLARATGLPVHVVDRPEHCALDGALQMLRGPYWSS